MNAQRAEQVEAVSEPSVVGVRVRPAWVMVLYGLLALSAGLALVANQGKDALPAPLRDAAPWLFLAFVVGFAVYRLALVLARRYSPFKAFFQVLVGLLFFMLLRAPLAGRTGDPSLLGHKDPRVRAMAAKVVGLERDRRQALALVPLLGDPSDEVRRAAHASLVTLAGGEDLGFSEQAWKERFK